MSRVEAALLAGEAVQVALEARYSGAAGLAVRRELEVLDRDTLLHVACSALVEVAHAYLDPAERPGMVAKVQRRRMVLMVHGDEL